MASATNGQISGGSTPFNVSAPVTSVFGRTGTILPQTGDYTISQISGAGTAAAENLSSVITDNGAGALTIGAGQITLAMLGANLSNLLTTYTGLNTKTVANTAIYTVPAGKTAIIQGAIITPTTSAAITTGLVGGFGNVAGTNNIAASTSLNALLTTADSFMYSIIGAAKTVAAGNSVYFNLGTAAVGTTQIVSIILLGFLI